jgi:hypothetical protein
VEVTRASPTTLPRRRRRLRLWLLCASGLAVLLLPLGRGPAARAGEGEPEGVFRVEEDWQLVLNQPDVAVNAPEFYTVMSPVEHTRGAFVQVSWNFRELEEYAPGGLEIQAWNGENFNYVESVGLESLSNTAETVTWTQVLVADEGCVRFKIVNGHSSSWGDFGGDALSIVVNGAPTTLNNYSPELTTRSSGITYGTNRVNLFVLKEVRWYGPHGLVAVDPTPRVVYRMPE